MNDKWNRNAYTKADNIIECDRKRVSRHPAFWIIVSYKCALACLCPRQIYLVAMWFTNSIHKQRKNVHVCRRIILHILFIITIRNLFVCICVCVCVRASVCICIIYTIFRSGFVYIYALLYDPSQEYDDQCDHHSEIFSQFIAAISYTFLKVNNKQPK